MQPIISLYFLIIAYISSVSHGFSVSSSHREASHSSLSVTENFEQYSRCLTPKEERDSVLKEGQDYKKDRARSRIRRAMTKGIQKIPKIRKKRRTGTLILIRCGLSEFNTNATFSGWSDPKLTEQGVEQCRKAGEMLLAEGFDPDIIYTSRLKRAIKSTWTILETIDGLFLPVLKTFRLNPRMYGALEGLSKQSIIDEFGESAMEAWQRAPKAKPPPLPRSDPSHPIHKRRYNDIDPDILPDSESILECHARTRPLWEYKISKDLRDGKTVMVVAHRETIQALVGAIEQIKSTQLQEIQIPYGNPLVYKFRESEKTLSPLRHSNNTAVAGRFLAKVAGPAQSSFRSSLKVKRVASLQDSLRKIRIDNRLVDDSKAAVQKTQQVNTAKWEDDYLDEFEDYDELDIFDDGSAAAEPVLLSKSTEIPEGPFVVLIRHGRTPHNNLGLFTGWEDPPLAEDGVEDARNAGRLLRKYGFQFDVCYTSWLTRAIQTAYYVLDELDSTWLPMVKSWRLNERMYGALTGKSKKMIANEYGDEQLKKWRRGYTIRPPPISSYSRNYPGNDLRRAKHFRDLPVSWRETINRSIEQRRFVLHRRFPKTESLRDCMDRSIPFYTKRILTEARDKRVLITSHENALRGILMHLCDIPEDAMSQLHLPNGLPLVYDMQRKCITLLDDGEENEHDFGPAAKYLFRSCESDQ